MSATESTETETARKQSQARTVLASVIGVALTLVIVAPIVLSSSDLMRWAADPLGLGLSAPWPWAVFVALDAAAATCVGMVVFAAWKGEPGGAFHLLIWLFAGGSAVANYRHGLTTSARDDEFFFPAMSLAGPLLLDVVMKRVRRWVRTEEGTQIAARPRFGMRWLPGVAFTETARAWATAQREGIAKPADAIALVRERDALAVLPAAEQVRYAWQALGGSDPYAARLWLTARGVQVDQSALDAAAEALRPAPTTVEVIGVETAPAGLPLPPAPTELQPAPPAAIEPAPAPTLAPGPAPAPASDPAPAPSPAVPSAGEPDLSGLSKRAAFKATIEHLGNDDVAAALAWMADRGVSFDKGEAYKTRRALADERARASRSQITAVPSTPGGAR